MASESAAEVFSPQNVLAGMVTMRGNDPAKKKVAMDYLARFQKSVCVPCPVPCLCRVVRRVL